VAYMPIRLNSKRVERKSVRLLGNRPLLCWSLEQLDLLGIPVCVYCSEPAELASFLDFEANNVRFVRRPVHLDDDLTIGIDIYREFSKTVSAKVYLLTHCTSPFVSANTYRKVVAAVTSGEYDSSCTVYKVQTFCWHRNSPINFSVPRPRTQDIEPIYVETSAAYCYSADVLDKGGRTGKRHKLVVTDKRETLDIDHMDDFTEAERLIW